jgi:hypothetical protein
MILYTKGSGYMNSRMDKYEFETPELKKRTDRNKELYQSYDADYDKFDVNSNVSVLKNNARSIDVEQIKEILDKKYRDNLPKRKSIDLPKEEEIDYKSTLEDTKEYDLNNILTKAKDEKSVNYDVERLSNSSNSQELIDKINEKYGKSVKEDDDAEELTDLIKTITALELKNHNKDAEFLDLADEDEISKTSSSIIEPSSEEEFYTGQLKVKEDDFEDFKDMQDDIRSNSIFIKVLTVIFIIVLLVVGFLIVNSVFDLGLFK